MSLNFLRYISNRQWASLAEDEKAKTRKGYELRATVLFVFLLLLAALNVGLVNYYLTRQQDDGHVVNVAGRQRMLGQKIAYLTHSVAAGVGKDRGRLILAIKSYEQALSSLRDGGRIMGGSLPRIEPELEKLVSASERLSAKYLGQAKIIVQHGVKEPIFYHSLRFIRDNSEMMFENDNRLTKALADLSYNKISNLNFLLFVLFGINGFFLMVVYLILHKTGRALRISREKLREYNEHLEEKIEERTKEIKEVKEVAILSLAKLTESRDPETGEHLERIQKYTQILAQELMKFDEVRGYIDEQYVQDIAKSSILHDIGKVGIPDRILLKPGKLTQKEFNIIKTHAIIGGKALAAADRQIGRESFLTMAKEIAFSHHEKYDGTGYPAGSKGKQIPLSARIVALADTYDAIRSKRPYKEPLSHEFAVKEISQQAGRHFDPMVVQAFLNKEAQFKRISTEFCSTLPEPMNIHDIEDAYNTPIDRRANCPAI